jgi:F-type H+-transporting ATPase subunit epsilon
MFKVDLVHISDKVLYSGQAHNVLLPGVMGEFEIEQDHSPILSLLSKGKVLIRGESSDNKYVMISQGVMRFDENGLYAVVE